MTTQEQRIDRVAELFPIPEQARTLERFIGEWTVEGTITTEGETGAMSGTWSFTRAAGGWGIHARLDGYLEGLGVLDEDTLVGFDAGSGVFHAYSLTNTGHVHDHPGGWVDADTLEFALDASQGGKPYREEISIRFTGRDELHIRGVEYIEGQVVTSMDARLRR
jgi:hypothetical protein